MQKSKEVALEKMQNEINEIHQAINISASPFRLIYTAKNFRFFFLVSGICSVLIPVIYHLLLIIYDSPDLIPHYLKVAFFFLIGICWFILMTIRTIISIKASKQLHFNLNIFGLFRQLLSTRMWLIILPFMGFSIIIPIKYAHFFSSTDYVPYLGIAIGLILNMIGVMINEREYSIAGYWMIFSGLLLFLIVMMPTHIAFGIIFSPAGFLFAFFAYLINKEEEEKV